MHHNNDWTSFYDELRRFILRRVRDSSLADDLVQEVFLKVYTRFYQLKNTDKLSAWIYQITRNTIVDYYRHHQRELNLAALDLGEEANPLSDCVTDCVQQVLATLPEKYRTAIELAEFANLPQTELARRLGISYSGAKSRVQRARQVLRKKMEEQLQIETDSYGNVLFCRPKDSCCRI